MKLFKKVSIVYVQYIDAHSNAFFLISFIYVKRGIERRKKLYAYKIER